MKEVIALIKKRKQEFAKLPLFQFLQDKSIEPRERLAWVSFLTPLAMGFGKLNKYDFRKEPINKSKCFEVVDKVFEIFTEAINEMRAYAEKHSISQLVTF